MKRRIWPRTSQAGKGQEGGVGFQGEQFNQVMDEIEAITTDLDALLANVPDAGGDR